MLTHARRFADDSPVIAHLEPVGPSAHYPKPYDRWLRAAKISASNSHAFDYRVSLRRRHDALQPKAGAREQLGIL